MRVGAVVLGLGLAVVSGAAAAGPSLPAEGLAIERGHRVELRTLGGALLARLPGYRLEESAVAVPGVLRLRDGRGRGWILGGGAGLRRGALGTPLRAGATLSLGRGTWSVSARGALLLSGASRRGLPLVSGDRDLVSVRGRALDVPRRRVVALPRDCAATARRGPVWILLCGGRAYAPERLEAWSGGRRRLLAANPFRRGVGHWVGAALSPDGARVLAQWSAECEVPVALLGATAGGKLRAVAAHGRDVPTSVALGWARDGRAAVFLPEGACGGSASRPGVYVVGRGGELRLAAAVRGLRARALLWSR